MMHRNRGGAEVSMLHHSNTSYSAFMPLRGWYVVSKYNKVQYCFDDLLLILIGYNDHRL